jgi:hypothetical protein
MASVDEHLQSVRRFTVKNAIAITAIAGFAAAAAAQSAGGISFNAPTSVAAGETFSVDVVATGDQAEAIVGFNLAISASDAASVGAPTGNASLFAFSTFSGVGDFEASGGTNVFAKASLPSGSVLFSFDVTAGSSNVVLSAQAGTVDALNALEWGEDVGFFLLNNAYDSVSFEDFTVIVPAPGAMAVLGLGGLAAARRRR